MAYITTEEVAVIRKQLKETFPKTFKFSVVRDYYSHITVALLSSPFSALEHQREFKQKHKILFKIIEGIVNAKNYDNSDSMTDFFDVGFYSTIKVGNSSKDYVQFATQK